jgi:hypothetical protein
MTMTMMIEQDKCYNNSFQQYVSQKSTGVTNCSSQVPKFCRVVIQPMVSSLSLFSVHQSRVPRPAYAACVQWNRQDGM